jgi:hypothetical protein
LDCAAPAPRRRFPTYRRRPLLQLDFLGDVYAECAAQLRRLGCRPDTIPTGEAVLDAFVNVFHRMIEARPRTFERAPEVASRSGDVAALEAKIRRGDDLKPHLSRRLLDAAHNDALQNDWGIYHLHLGATLQPDGFVERTDELLFVRVTDAAIYGLAIAPHGRFGDTQLLEIVHRHWPQQLRPYVMKAVSVSPDLTSDEIAELRAAGMSMAYNLPDGTVLMPPGGGYATNGSSTRVRRQADDLVRQVRAFEAFARAYEDKLRAAYERQTGAAPTSDRVHLLLHQGTALVRFSGTKVGIPLGKLA